MLNLTAGTPNPLEKLVLVQIKFIILMLKMFYSFIKWIKKKRNFTPEVSKLPLFTLSSHKGTTALTTPPINNVPVHLFINFKEKEIFFNTCL